MDDAEVDEAPAPTDPDGWDPVPVTLPTYVDKAPAVRRSGSRTIDLDYATGVLDLRAAPRPTSALAREADAARGTAACRVRRQHAPRLRQLTPHTPVAEVALHGG